MRDDCHIVFNRDNSVMSGILDSFISIGVYTYGLMIKLVRSRWLHISQVLFCVFRDRDVVEVHKHAKKNEANIQPS